MSPARQNVFVGIDVAKDWLDIAVRPTGAAWRVAQDDEGIADLVRQLAKLQPKLIVMEASGGYERLPAPSTPLVAGERPPREFAKSQGKLAKTDRLDAALAAHFGEVSDITPRPLPTAEARARSPRHAPPPAHPDADAEQQRRPQAPSIGTIAVFRNSDIDADLERRLRDAALAGRGPGAPSPSPCWRNCPNSARASAGWCPSARQRQVPGSARLLGWPGECAGGPLHDALRHALQPDHQGVLCPLGRRASRGRWRSPPACTSS